MAGIITLPGGYLLTNGITGNAGDERGVVSVSAPVVFPDIVSAYSMSPATVASALSISGFRCKSRPFRQHDDGEFEVTFNFEGTPPEYNFEDEETTTTYELDGSTSEDPIETHPDFERIAEIYGIIPDPEGNGQFVGFERFLKTGGANGAQKKSPMYGAVGYLVGGCVWRRTSVVRTFPPALLRSLGKIDTPPGNPPELPGKRNWIKIRVTARWRGNVWELTEEWLMSGDGGWVPEVYRRSA